MRPVQSVGEGQRGRSRRRGGLSRRGCGSRWVRRRLCPGQAGAKSERQEGEPGRSYRSGRASSSCESHSHPRLRAYSANLSRGQASAGNRFGDPSCQKVATDWGLPNPGALSTSLCLNRRCLFRGRISDEHDQPQRGENHPRDGTVLKLLPANKEMLNRANLNQLLGPGRLEAGQAFYPRCSRANRWNSATATIHYPPSLGAEQPQGFPRRASRASKARNGVMAKAASGSAAGMRPKAWTARPASPMIER